MRTITHVMLVQNETYVIVFKKPYASVTLANKGDNLLSTKRCREESRCSKFYFQ